ncbi:hypothetical protein SS50377_22107 [Spironucleus salmonicida]|uniref:Hydin-like protein n=1 Tax=Spironucleus salmonicida TaxID=348837 RepID=V6LPU5_9EUKA|nr:hypothetical protein SS50377_22107 [Spironucleus salmonicida]|eukprot:EST45731.1 Hydin-like protein [Spironucleus salmonicida]
MDLPDQIDFGNTYFNMLAEQSLFLSNSSKQVFNILIVSPSCVTVSPQQFSLEPGSSINVSIQCIPNEIEYVKDVIQFIVNQTQVQLVNIIWTTIESEIKLEKHLNRFKPTLIEQTTQDQTSIKNVSEQPLNFSLHDSPFNDSYFSSNIFQIQPLTGIIYPTSYSNILCKFKPISAQSYKEFCYIQVDGIQNRYRIELEGIGLPPEVDFDCDQIDFDDIVLNQLQTAEGILTNASDIQIQFKFIEKQIKDLGLKISINEGVIPPCSALPIYFSVQPQQIQQFNEKLIFEILGSDRLIALEINVNCRAPTLTLKVDLDDPDENFNILDFKIVPFGFGSRKEIHVFNESAVNQKIECRIDPVIRNNVTLLNCADFSVQPSQLEIPANSSLPLSVVLLPKQGRGVYEGFQLNIFVKGVEGSICDVPVCAQVTSAKFIISPSVFEIQQAYVGFEHKIELNIKNTSNVVGRWVFPNEEQQDAWVVKCSQLTGVLDANSEQRITVSLIPSNRGSLVVPINFMTDDRQEMQCMVQYSAIGPQIDVSSEQIKFPQIEVLDITRKPLTISNTGLSDSFVRISASKAGSFFTVDKEFQQFELLSGQSKEIMINLSANIQGNHQDDLIVYQELLNPACDVSEDVLKQISNMKRIKLKGTTKGTSLYSPNIDFSKPIFCGTYFIGEQINKQIIIENHGPEVQHVTWYPSKTSILKFEQTKIILNPGESGTFILTGLESHLCDGAETWQVKSSVPGKQTDTAFIANFTYKYIENQIKIMQNNEDLKRIDLSYKCFPIHSSQEEFFGEKLQDSEEYIKEIGDSLHFINKQIIRKIQILNTSTLFSRVQIAVHSPFSIQISEEEPVQFRALSLEPGIPTDIYVTIDEEYCVSDRITKQFDSLVIFKLLPSQQSSTNAPLIKVPIKLNVYFPLAEFRSCSHQQMIKFSENYDTLFDNLQSSESIDFGSIVPGTTVKRYILAKNSSEFPIQLNWSLQNIVTSYYNFDITPAQIAGDSSLQPNQIGVFDIAFQCKAADKNGLKVTDSQAICEIVGGPAFEYALTAEASNLAVDVQPSHINFGDISFVSEQTTVLSIINISQVCSQILVKVPKECLPFIKKIGDIIIEKEMDPIWNFKLAGGQKLDLKLVLIPRIPGQFNIPVSIKAGHLEEVVVPIMGQALVECVQLSYHGKQLDREKQIIPWLSQYQMPCYSSFALAAQSFHRAFPLKYNLFSTLEKEVSEDGTIQCYGQTVEPLKLQVIDQQCYQTITEFVLIHIERHKYENGTSPAVRMPSRAPKSGHRQNMQFVNDNAITQLKLAQDVPKNPLLFTYRCTLPPGQRGVACQASIEIKNSGQNPINFQIERKFLAAYNITVDPEKIPRITSGDIVVLNISYTPSLEAQLGEHKFLIPLLFRSSAIGYVSCICNVTSPTLKLTNLMQLADNFVNIPIDIADNQNQVLHLGQCLYGRANRFAIRLVNPTTLNATFTCDASGGIGRQYRIDSKEPISLNEKVSQRLEDCFQLSTSHGAISSYQEGIVSITFKPIDWYKLREYGYGNLFIGDLKFNIKNGAEANSKIIVKVIAVGYHPLIKISQNIVKMNPVFPQQISQNIGQIELINNSQESVEVFIEEFDNIHQIENQILDVLTEELGNVFTKKQQKTIEKFLSAYLPDFPRAGQLFSPEILDHMRELQLDKLVDFLDTSYESLVSQEDIKTLTPLSPPKSQQDSRVNNKSGEVDSLQEDTQKTRVESAKSSITVSYEIQKQQRLAEYNIDVDQQDFSYPLTILEETSMRYGKQSLSVINGKSFRISETDSSLSNLPFLVYIVDGAPLSGKTTFARKIQSCFTNKQGLNIPIFNIDALMQESQVCNRYKEEQQQQQSIPIKGKKPADIVAPVDFRLQDTYILELAQEYAQIIQNYFETSSDLNLGCVFDGIDSQFIENKKDQYKLIYHIIKELVKPTLYDKQVYTSRLFTNITILDQNPEATRKQAMQIIMNEYNQAIEEDKNSPESKSSEECEQRISLAKLALTGSKQNYDSEHEYYSNSSVELVTSSEKVQQNYDKVNISTDDLGTRHLAFMNNREQIQEGIEYIHSQLVQLHTHFIDSNSDKSELQQEIDDIQIQIDQVQAELIAKKNNKVAQQKLDDLRKLKEEKIQTLPDHPVNSIPKENIFSSKYYLISDYQILNENIFDEQYDNIVSRFILAINRYKQVLINMEQNQAVITKNERLSTIEELLVRNIQQNAQTKIQQLISIINIEDLPKVDDVIYQILNDIYSPTQLLEKIYSDVKEKGEEIFTILPINHNLIDFEENRKTEISTLIQVTDLTPVQVKALNKTQQAELQQKKQRLSQLQQVQDLFTGQNLQQEIGFARWIVPANSVQKLSFRFYSNQIRKENIEINLSVRSSEFKLPITFECSCDWPHIIDDFTQIFTQSNIQNRGFKLDQQTYKFGTLRCNVPVPDLFTKKLLDTDEINNNMTFLEMNNKLSEQGSVFITNHFQALNLKNISEFPTNIAIFTKQHIGESSMEDYMQKIWKSDESLIVDDPKAKKTDPKKGQQTKIDENFVFNVFPNKVILQPGEVINVILSAFPDFEKDFDTELYLCIEHNPTNLSTNLSCTGIIPTAQYTIPDCQDGLQSCLPWQQDITNLIQAQSGIIVDPKAKQTKTPSKGGDKNKQSDKVQNNNILMLPRVSLNQTITVDVPITNTNKLPLKVHYEQQTTDATQQFINLFETPTPSHIEEQQPKVFNKKLPQPPRVFSIQSGNLYTKNVNFMLKPNETQNIQFSFKSSKIIQHVFPGRLLIQQYNAKKNGPECQIESLKDFSKHYLSPIIDQPLTVVSEAHHVDVIVAVTNISESENKITKNQPVYSLESQIQNIQFGICKALSHFRSEITIVNQGPYDVSFKASFAKALDAQLNFVSGASPPSASGSKPAKGKPQVVQQENFDKVVDMILPTQPKVDEKAKTKDKNAQPMLSQTTLYLDFFSDYQQELQTTPAINIVFSDPITKKLLSKSVVTISAKINYSEISIQPDRLLLFGDLSNGKEITRNITVENTGNFPTIFVIERFSQVLLRQSILGVHSQFDEKYFQEMKNLKIDPSKLQNFGISTENLQILLQSSKESVKDAKKPGKDVKPVSSSFLHVDQFAISPQSCLLAPGDKQVISVKYTAKGTSNFKEFLVVDWANRIPSLNNMLVITEQNQDKIEKEMLDEYTKQPEVQQNYPYNRKIIDLMSTLPLLKYAIQANSQIPGISSNVNDLFEEQQVQNQAPADPAAVTEGIYSTLANQLTVGNSQLNSVRKERIRFYNPFSVESNFIFILTTKTDSVEQIIKEALGETIQSVLAYGKPESSRAGGKSKPDPKVKGKQNDNIVTNDDSAWFLDVHTARIMPNEAIYVTVNYKPTQQVTSKARFIGLSIDNWLRIQELMQGLDAKSAAGLDKKIMGDLQSTMKEADLKNSQISFEVLGVGVLPELLISPQIIDLGRVLVNVGDIEKREICIKNTGRVLANYSINIQAQQRCHQDCFQLMGETDNRLFSGLKEVQPEQTSIFYIAAFLPSLYQLSSDVKIIHADVSIKIMTSDDEFQEVIIPVSFEVLQQNVCAIAAQMFGTHRRQFYEDVTQLLFNIPQNSTLKQSLHQLFGSVIDCSTHKNNRISQLQQYGTVQESILGQTTVFITDGVVGEDVDYSYFKLVNQSNQHYIYDIDQTIMKKTGILITPAYGHLQAGQTQEFQIQFIQPSLENTDPKAKKPTVSRTILFGNPLLIRIIKISYKSSRHIQQWNNDSQLPEPDCEIVLDDDIIAQLKAEYDDLLLQQTKKVKFNPQQTQKMQVFQKLFAPDSTKKQMAQYLEAQFLELNLFGSMANVQLKYYIQQEDSTFIVVQPQVKEKLTILELPFQSIAILQKAGIKLHAINEGLAAPPMNFNQQNDFTPFIIKQNEFFLPRPDLYSAAVKETLPQISDSQLSSQIIIKLGINPKSVDKNFAQTLAQKYAQPGTSPYSSVLELSFEPKIPGSFNEFFESHKGQYCLNLSGQATLPICHIECPPSQYLQKERPSSYPTPYIFANLIAQNTKSVKVLEISGVGIGVRTCSILNIMNTIAQNYDIQIIRLQESSNKIVTQTSNYTLMSGENISVRFDYMPDKASLKQNSDESFYIIKIPQFNIQVPLLVVGKPQEPDVCLSTTKLSFGAIQFGNQKQLEVTITNNEAQPYNYRIRKFEKTDIFEVKVTPNQGIVPPKGSTTIVIQCKPSMECKISKVVYIDIARKSLPLSVNIKYECFKAKHLLELLPENEQVGVPQTISNIYDLDYETVFIADQKTRRLKLTNIGLHNLQFSSYLDLQRTISTTRRNQVELKKCNNNYKIAVIGIENNGTHLYQLPPGQACFIELAFAPKEDIQINKEFGLFVNINVENIGLQKLRIFGKGVKPGLKSSLQFVDFGTVLADLSHERCSEQIITFINHDIQPLTLEFISQSTDFFIVTPPEQKPLLPGQSLKLKIRFQPLFAQQFKSNLLVTVNGLYKLKYPLIGNAVTHNLIIDQKNIQLGGILTNSSPLYRIIPIKNKSAATINFGVQFKQEVEQIQGLFISLQQQERSAEIISKSLDQLTGWNQRQNKKAYLDNLLKDIIIQPNSSIDILIFYAPVSRQTQFQASIDLTIEKCITIEGFSSVSGSAIGASVRLLSTSVDLPPCLQNSFVQNEFQIENTGDIPVEFNIPIPPKTIIKKNLIDMFTQNLVQIRPLTGHVLPGQALSVTVRFQPTNDYPAGKYLLQNIPVEYQFQSKTYQIGTFNVLAICENKENFYSTLEHDVTFDCPTREQASKIQKIDNSTDRPFEVKTVLQGDGDRHFQVPDRLIIPPGGCEFNVVFSPLTQGDHKAKLIIAGSEGGAVVFNLQGIAQPPKLDGYITNVKADQAKPQDKQPTKGKSKEPVQAEKPLAPQCANTINLSEIFAYKSVKIQIPLNNWEKHMQRFNITHDTDIDNGMQLVHPEFIDVPPAGTDRIAELIFISFLSNQEFNGNIIFKNEKSGEFLKFQYKLFSLQAEPSLIIPIQTTCRDIITKQVQIPNPLQISQFPQLSMNATNLPSYITVMPQQFSFNPKQATLPLKISYEPQVPTTMDEFDVKLEIKAQTDKGEVCLANLLITIKGIANAPRPSSPLKVQADLGKTLEFAVNLLNKSPKPANFSILITELSDINEIFQLLEKVPAGSGKGKDSGMIDNKNFFSAKNCVSTVNSEVVGQAKSAFSIPLKFTPNAMGAFAANCIIYSKGSGIWLVPVVGKCLKPPASGVISFE